MKAQSETKTYLGIWSFLGLGLILPGIFLPR
jgi:hypothetical protein